VTHASIAPEAQAIAERVGARMFDASSGWLALAWGSDRSGLHYYRTSDGGGTWSSTDTPARPRFVAEVAIVDPHRAEHGGDERNDEGAADACLHQWVGVKVEIRCITSVP